MTSTLSAQVGTLLETAAAAATAGLTIGEPTSFSELAPQDTSADAFAGAISVSFAGSFTGELALLVDVALREAVTQGGAVELLAALKPAIAAIGNAIGDVTLGVPEVADPQLVRNQLINFPESGAIAIRGASSTRAAVVVGLDSAPQGGAQSAPVSADRLDLLRGVEMQASTELGRAKMTVHELLNLRPGAVIELDRAAGDPVDLYVNGRLLARGEVVVVDENYALRVTQIVTDDSAR